MKTTRLCTVALLLAAWPAALGAQAWDAPSFLSPRPGDDLGFYYVQPDRADWGLAGIWRQSGSIDLGLRAAIFKQKDVPGADGDIAFGVGSEFFGTLLRAGADFPLDVTWALGAGATFGDVTHFRIPAGVSVGRTLGGPGIVIQPYVHPRVALDGFASDGNSETDFILLSDVGVDVGLTPSLKVRLGVTFGDDDALGLGAAFRMERGVEVR